MLVYEKKIDNVRHLFGTINSTIPSISDLQLTYKDADGNSLTLSEQDTYLDNGHGGIIRKSDNKIVNVFIGNTQIIGSAVSPVSPEGEVIINGTPDALYQSGGDHTSIGFIFESEPSTLANIKVGTTFTVEINDQSYDFTIAVVNTEVGNRNYASSQSTATPYFSLRDTIEGFACEMFVDGDVRPITNFKVIQTSDYEPPVVLSRKVKVYTNGATTQEGYYNNYDQDVADGKIVPDTFVSTVWSSYYDNFSPATLWFTFGEPYLQVIVTPENKYFNGFTTVQNDSSTLVKDIYVPFTEEDNVYYILWGDTEMETVTLTIDLDGGKYFSQDDYVIDDYWAPKGCILDESLFFKNTAKYFTKQGYEYGGLTTVKNDPSTKISTFTANTDSTLYVLWEAAE